MMSVGSDDSGSSDLTSFYCIGCDARHELGSDAPPFVCGTKYSSDEESVDNHGDIIRLPAARLARYQVSIIIDPVTGVETPAGSNAWRANNDRRRNGEASGSDTNTTISVSQSEWDAAQNAVVNNTCLPLGVSQGTLNAYHAILEKNRVRLAKEQAELDRHRRAADLSSERRAELSSLGSIGSKSNQPRNKYHPAHPAPLEEGRDRNHIKPFQLLHDDGHRGHP
jgi:hypothetical protein